MSTVGRNDPCPCGSGLKYKQCCAGKIRLNVKGRRGWMLGVIGIGVVAVVAWGLVRAQSRPAVPTGMGTPLSSTGTGTGAVASTPVTTTSTVTVGPGGTINPAPAGTGAPITMTPGTGAPMMTPTVGSPKAWDYDPVTNRHFDPGHGHWHDGPAPPPEARGTSSSSQSVGGITTTPGGHAPSGTTPAPWTYDAAKNQHWDPGHGHWHQGPPPAGSR